MMCHKENCTQCVIDEVDAKLETLLFHVNLVFDSDMDMRDRDMRDLIVAIRDDIHPLVSC